MAKKILDHASKGGKARARALSPEERSAIARQAVEARWRKAGLLKEVLRATHGSPDHPLRIGDIEIPCYVLEDGRRVLVQRETVRALGMAMGGSSYRGGDRLARFASQNRLKPFAKPNLAGGTLKPIPFITTKGMRALGYEATILPDICDAVLDARRAGQLTAKQEHVAQRCEILMRGFARVGIIALVDEATGYQDARARDALAKILEKFVEKELQKWVKTFPAQFYKEMFRLRGLPYNGKCRKPQYIGHLTNDLVYVRVAPGVLAELRRKNPADERGRRKARHHQWLTRDLGHPKLLEHLAAVTALMRASDGWDQFYAMLERAIPKYTPLPLWEGMGVTP